MYEIRFHGRGGQGAVLASKILAKALVEEGKSIKAIPAFGFERRGAPVEAYLRFDDNVIRSYTNIYAPDCIICLDPTLLNSVNIFSNLKDNATWVHATKKTFDSFQIPDQIATAGFCDAFGIAMNIFGRPITNTIMLGAFARVSGAVTLDSLNAGMEAVAFRDAALEKNIEALKRGYDETIVLDQGEEAR